MKVTYYRGRDDRTATFIGLSIVAVIGTVVAAFIRHVWWVITICMSGQPLVGGQIVMAVIGIIFPPIGALHGVWLWLN